MRSLPGVRDMRAVRTNSIVVMPQGTGFNGPLLVEVAEFLCDAVYGPPPVIEAAEITDETITKD